MAECPTRVTNISPSEFLGESLFKLNTNYFNIDSGVCQLGKDLQALDTFIKSFKVRDSSTIDASFSIAGYFLSADVVNNSLGTVKLGVDIPQTTKTFLKIGKLGSLIDVDATTLNLEYGLRWDNTNLKWITSPLTDEFGASNLPDLKDVKITNLKNNDVLRYISSSSLWINSPDSCLSAVPDGDYDDINVSGFGQIWNIRPERVGEVKLQTAAVQTPKIGNLQVVNSHFAKATIKLEKVNFAVGEANTAVNIGDDSGRGIATGTKQGSKILFKSLKGSDGCIISSTNEEILITASQPPDPLPPTGDNLISTGESVFSGVTPTTNVFQFKSLKAGSNINLDISSDGNEITISRVLGNLGLTLLDLNADSSPLTEQQIIAKVSLIYPPERFSTNTVCNVTVETPSTITPNNLALSIPYQTSYEYKSWAVDTYTPVCCIAGICEHGTKGCTNVKTGTNYYMNLRWKDPEVAPTSGLVNSSTATETSFPVPNPAIKQSTSGYWGGYKNITTSISLQNSEGQLLKFALTTRTQKVYKVSSTKTWIPG